MYKYQSVFVDKCCLTLLCRVLTELKLQYVTFREICLFYIFVDAVTVMTLLYETTNQSLSAS